MHFRMIPGSGDALPRLQRSLVVTGQAEPVNRATQGHDLGTPVWVMAAGADDRLACGGIDNGASHRML